MVNENAPMVSVENINLSVGEFSLRDVSFRVERGEYLMLLGPTGCGKTLLAETICGLNTPNSGTIHIDGRSVTRSDPAERKIGYVPQDYALLPFKSVAKNIAFGLQARRASRKLIGERLDMMLDILEISHLRDRYPAHLSGGERQRVALGRALAIEPDLLALDEPLSALDEGTFRDLIERLKRLHRELKTTIIHICHRLDEVVALGDKIVLMRNGRIEQAGSTSEIFARPRNLFVARFLRLRNLIKGEVESSSNGNIFHVNNTPVAETDLPADKAYAIIPLDKLTISMEHPGDEDGYVVLNELIAENNPGPCEPGLQFNGELDLKIPGIFPASRWRAGQKVYFKFPRASIHLLPAESSETTKQERQ